jgi:hypothetical protein
MDGVEVLPYVQDRAERLAMLRTQRNLLLNLCAEITAMRRRLADLDPRGSWTSQSQRAYLLCVTDVVEQVDLVLYYLNEALHTVRVQIYDAEILCRA